MRLSSLILPGGLMIEVEGTDGGKGRVVVIGGQRMPIADFVQMVEHVFTSTVLVPDDPRDKFLVRAKSFSRVAQIGRSKLISIPKS
ncbi:hypothetical protein KKG41_02770 [Patescibacteria group bacterium]|nr:hypothetical protein [Patescibacteria group bacterium]MBU1890059.1 hypothetical protein [Patescibacteria group bacterium]